MTASEITRKAFLLPVYFYRACISPILPDSCRHSPTCSQYCIQAIMIHGIITGSMLTAFRILRCAPWGTHGYDPVPEKGHAWEYMKGFFCKRQDTESEINNKETSL